MKAIFRQVTLGRLAVLVALAALTLAVLGCAPAPASPAPSSSASVEAEGATLDEKALVGCELAYKIMRIGLEVAVDSGQLTGARAERAIALDDQAYSALLLARAAFGRKDAEGYAAAVIGALAAIDTAALSIKGDPA